MKVFKMTVLSFALVASAGSLSAMAAETAQITVKGAVIPAACSISVDGSADFGNLADSAQPRQAKNHMAYHLGYKLISFNIQCDSTVKAALYAQADNLPTAQSPFGVTNYISEIKKTIRTDNGQIASLGLLDDQDMGYFITMLASATLDGESAELMFSKDNGVHWNAVTELDDHVLYQDGSVLHSWGSGITPQEATNISGVIKISAAIDPKVVDELKDAVNFNTGTTLSLQYL
ncbi:DUF1120 domain-containing protein [Serratia silvae]|uniref:DUF1120 domain-containing protein n=1 Tax=Serratia silvae TaxID=2824122 RepID=A0ABT0K878_9GAMM|nr:DUF1120 domain-containing protein [Serratia silvae]MCL1027982.1 DUF1120 domain-containing protein [Serratia silvae]